MTYKFFDGWIYRCKTYPVALSGKQIHRHYRREFSRWGRLLNDIEHRWLCWKYENDKLTKIADIWMILVVIPFAIWCIVLLVLYLLGQ